MNIFEKFRALKPLHKGLIIGGAALVVLLIAGLIVWLCVGGSDAPVSGTYTVEVKNDAGTPLEDLDVYIYRDKAQSDLVAFSKTDETGKMTFTADDGIGCFAVLRGVPDGYAVEEYYEITGETTGIVLKAGLRQNVDLSATTFKLGDIMAELTFTDTEGKEHKLSDLLSTKKAVVLNFWYTGCNPCVAEFPYLQQAYETYKDRLEVLALNPTGETNEAIAQFKATHKLTFPMGACDKNWEKAMQIIGYPTTVVIDRTGMIAFMHCGTIPDAATFETIFAYYTADDYVQKTATSADELAEDIEPNGTKDHPYEIGGTLEFDAAVMAGSEVYYNVYKVGGTTLKIQNAHAYVIYNGKTYKAEDGVVSVPVETEDVTIPVQLIIGNGGTVDVTYRVTFEYDGGTQAKPYTLALGDLTTELSAGNDQGVVYLYTATQSGTLTVKVNSITSGVKYDIALYNLNTYAMRTLEEDGANNTVSVVVNKGDQVQMTVSTLPNEENEYPAAVVKSTVSFKTGAGTTDSVQKSISYSVTVKDNTGKVVSGVKFSFAVNGKTASATTNSSGKATVSLPAGDCIATMTVPSGYIASATEVALSANKTTGTITLEKEAVIAGPGTTPTDYTVKLTDASGKVVTGATVQFYNNNTKYGEKKVDSTGTAKITLKDATYTIKLTGTSLKYDESAAKVTATDTSLELLLTDKSVTGTTAQNSTKIEKAALSAGATHVVVTPGKTNYFCFSPSESGLYLFTATNPSAKVGYHGMPHFVQPAYTTESDDYKPDSESNAFSLNIRASQIGGSYVIGIAAPTNVSATVLRVTRVGEAGTSIADQPWVDYKGTTTVKPFTYKGGALTNFDIKAATSTYKLVLGSDGYYHLGSATGKLVYMRLGADAPYASLAALLGLDGGSAGSNFGSYQYGSGSLVKESYNVLLGEYVANMDQTHGIYPLTADLAYMIQQGGEHRGWWDSSSGGYLFTDDDFEPIPGINTEIGWMYALCYEK